MSEPTRPAPSADERERDLFLEALEHPAGPERAAWLDRACAGNRSLHEAVEALLKNHKTDGFLETPVIDKPRFTVPGQGPAGTVLALHEKPGDRIGNYKLLQEIGEGACGTVYMADQEEPVRRRVALKVIKPGMDSKSVIARFEAERQAVAMMDHPNIAKVFDAGTTSAGRPYFVMELVRGVRMTDYCDQNQLSTLERLELFIKVCHAIQHAHQKGIIHRDIKPSNLLVTLHDGVPVPKVIDFGIAKAVEQQLTEKTVFTQFHAFIGTPAYTSPEQAEMSGLDIDTRSDIYSLGVLLYELLTGQTPFDAKTLLSSGLDEMRRIIREEEPVRPSTRLSTLGVADATALSRSRQAAMPGLVQAVRGDLDWIVMKCLEKDRTRRYPTANELALDIKRYMESEPVLARPPSPGYRLRKFVRRNRVVVTASAVVGLVLAGALVVSTWLAIRAWQAEREQVRLRRAAETSERKAVDESRHAERERVDALRRAYTSDMNLVQMALAAKNHGRVIDLLERQRPKAIEADGSRAAKAIPDFRQWEWRYFWSQSRSDAAFALPKQTNSIQQVALSPANGRLLLTTDRSGVMKLWDLMSRNEVAVVRKGFGPSTFAFSHDGTRLAVAFGGRDWRGVKIFTVATRAFTSELAQRSDVESLVFTPDDTQLLTFGRDGVIRTWDLEKQQEISQAQGQPVEGPKRPVFSGDGKWLALLQGSSIRVLDTRNGQTRCTLDIGENDHWSLAFSPDGNLLAAGPSFMSTSTTIKLFSAEAGQEVGELTGHVSWVPGLVFSNDGQRLISAGGDQTVRVWDVQAQRELVSLQGHLSEVSAVAITPDGKTVVSGCKDGSLFAWDLEHTTPRPAFETLPTPVSSVEFFPDSRSLLSVNADGSVSLWDTAALHEIERVAALGTDISRILLSSDGSRLYAGTWRGQIKVLDWATRLVITNLVWASSPTRGFGPGGPEGPARPDGPGHPGRPGGQGGKPGGPPGGLNNQNGPIAFADAGRTLVAAGPGMSVRLIDTVSWETKAEWKTGETSRFFAPHLVLSPDERFLVVGGSTTIEFRDLLTGKVDASLPAQNWGVSGLAFSPDNRLLATSSADGTVNLWDAQERKLVDVLRGHMLGVHAVGFSPDGERLATISYGTDAVKLWDVVTRHEVATLAGQGTIFDFVKFSPDGKLIVAINQKRSACLWRAPTREEIAVIEARAGN